jgi:hypothetical protein
LAEISASANHLPGEENVGDMGTRGRGKRKGERKRKENSTQKILLSTVFLEVRLP